MAKHTAITLCLCAAIWNSLVLHSLGAAGCTVVNEIIDKVISSSNADVIKYNEALFDVADFLQDFDMTLLWFTLPFKTNLYATDGLLKLGSLSRSGGAVQCSNASSVTLQGVLNYDQFTVEYDMTAKFYRWQTDGSFSCIFRQPGVNLVYTKGDPLGCRIVSLDLESSGHIECEVTPDNNSWTAWLVGKALHYALLSKQSVSNSIVSSFLQGSYSMIETGFEKYWC